MGIDTLKAVGGNDTERELLTAIQTNVDPRKTNAYNQRVIREKTAAFEVVLKKPGMMTEWIDNYGSLANQNENGQSWSEFYANTQRTLFRDMIYVNGSRSGQNAPNEIDYSNLAAIDETSWQDLMVGLDQLELSDDQWDAMEIEAERRDAKRGDRSRRR